MESRAPCNEQVLILVISAFGTLVSSRGKLVFIFVVVVVENKVR